MSVIVVLYIWHWCNNHRAKILSTSDTLSTFTLLNTKQLENASNKEPARGMKHSAMRSQRCITSVCNAVMLTRVCWLSRTNKPSQTTCNHLAVGLHTTRHASHKQAGILKAIQAFSIKTDKNWIKNIRHKAVLAGREVHKMSSSKVAVISAIFAPN